LDPGLLEHLNLSPRAVNGPGARSLAFLAWDPHAEALIAGEKDPAKLARLAHIG